MGIFIYSNSTKPDYAIALHAIPNKNINNTRNFLMPSAPTFKAF